MIGSERDVCHLVDGQCMCKANYAGRQCDQCTDGYFKYPDCDRCNCDPQGTHTICNKDDGSCICKEGFGGDGCDQVLAVEKREKKMTLPQDHFEEL